MVSIRALKTITKLDFIFLLTFIVLACETQLIAGAWVKEEGRYYVKLGLSQSQEQSYTSPIGGSHFLQKASALSLYGEVGLPFSSPLQLISSLSYKTIERQTADGSDTYVNQGLGDTELSLKYPLLLPTHLFESQINALLALSGGVILPTTPKNLRAGQEASRYDEVSINNRQLISSIDRGDVLYLLSIDSSFNWQALWLSLSEKVSGSAAGTSSYAGNIDLGLGLPWHSWIQITWNQHIFIDKPVKTHTTKTGIGLGFTAVANLAFELAYFNVTTSEQGWEDHSQINLGVSLRSL